MGPKIILTNAVVVAVLVNLGCVCAKTGPIEPVLTRPSLPSVFAGQAVLLGITRAGDRLVAAGERGIIVLSDDGGRNWRQASVPVSVTLTAVDFPTPREGWAVGHSGIILRSSDGGEHWSKQLDGFQLAARALSDAQANVRAHPSPRSRNDLHAAMQLVEDGPDKPFFFVNFTDARHGVAGGADGIFFETKDAGVTWRPRMNRVENPDRRHLYALTRRGQTVYIVGEQGYLARSDDGGANFQRLVSPYRGTLFAAAALSGGDVLIAGLRGHAYSSGDRGKTFRAVRASPSLSFSGLMAFPDGSVVLTDDTGSLLQWRRGQSAMTSVLPTATGLPALTGVAEAPDRTLVTVGLGGAIRLERRRVGV